MNLRCVLYGWSPFLRFVTRSFFVTNLTQEKADNIASKMGWGTLKAGLEEHCNFDSILFLVPGLCSLITMLPYIYVHMVQVPATARKSVTISWQKNGGLVASLGPQQNSLCRCT